MPDRIDPRLSSPIVSLMCSSISDFCKFPFESGLSRPPKVILEEVIHDGESSDEETVAARA